MASLAQGGGSDSEGSQDGPRPGICPGQTGLGCWWMRIENPCETILLESWAQPTIPRAPRRGSPRDADNDHYDSPLLCPGASQFTFNMS